MHAAASLLLFIIPLVVACGAILYHLAVTAAALRFRFQPEPDTGCTPPVSILKPVRGMERNFYATLAGYFQQDYPAYEIVFGLDDAKDPAHWTIAQLRHDFPNLPVKVV